MTNLQMKEALQPTGMRSELNLMPDRVIRTQLRSRDPGIL